MEAIIRPNAESAARLVEQKQATSETLAAWVVELAENSPVRLRMQECLARWHAPRAAGQIAKCIMAAIVDRRRASGGTNVTLPPNLRHRHSVGT